MPSLFSLFLHILPFLPSVWPSCEVNLLSQCTACCAMLFSDEECRMRDVFRIKVNGNGALGAIWDDHAMAAIVRPGCLLDLWDLRNQTGTHRSFGLDGNEVYPFERYAFERRASSVRCTCVSTPPPTTTEDPLPEYDGEEEEEEEYHGDDRNEDSNSTVQL